MAEEKKPVKITETVLRDAHQSLIATRMTTEQMLPIIDKMDKVGYHSVECWGGATFDACLRFLKEDPWDRLRKLRDGFKNTKLQMLFRGQNILGYSPYSDDVVEYFVQKSIANGIDIIRIFDCLNDIRNLETAVKAANKENGHAQVALSYTLGDAYTMDYWKNMDQFLSPDDVRFLPLSLQALLSARLCRRYRGNIVRFYRVFPAVFHVSDLHAPRHHVRSCQLHLSVPPDTPEASSSRSSSDVLPSGRPTEVSGLQTVQAAGKTPFSTHFGILAYSGNQQESSPAVHRWISTAYPYTPEALAPPADHPACRTHVHACTQ